MVRVDWSEEESLGAGVYRVKILSAQEKTSRSSGAPMMNVRLGAVDFELEHLCYDNIMLGGKGRSMGHAKMKAFGIEKGKKEVHPSDFEGREAIAVVVEGEYNGKPRLEVAADRGYCGYFPMDEAKKAGPLTKPDIPANAGEENPFLDADDTPF